LPTASLTTPTAEDSSTLVLAGQTWGGGGTINWSACLQTQGYVRQEWADTGLPLFTSADYQDCLDTVFERMGVSADHIHHNKGNRVLLEGAHKLGWSAKPVAQNTAGKQHYCGYCSLGCASCEKQGPTVSYLPAAAKAGAQFIEGFDVKKVLFSTSPSKNGDKIATGIVGTWTSRDEHGGVSGPPLIKRPVHIHAKLVIIAAGTMQSPLILHRSDLSNPHIGKHLKLHPVSLIGAIYDSPDTNPPWEGSILTSVVTEFENLDGRGHGPKLESITMLPSTWLSFPWWQGGLDYKVDFVPRMKNMVGHFALQRDVAEGEVYADPVDGRSRFRYHPHKIDKTHLMEGLVALAKINFISGAREIFSMIPGVPRFVRACESSSPSSSPNSYSSDGINDPAFKAWLAKLCSTSFPNPDSVFGSAHQMGTCRMAASSKNGVVDVKGRVFGTRGLYVADASVFPSASGVNPMVTNMAIAEWISRNLVLGSETAMETKAQARL
jgi:choline dehydrogenase-like flavoprotein